jgi:hypothetical protein
MDPPLADLLLTPHTVPRAQKAGVLRKKKKQAIVSVNANMIKK